MKISTVRIQNLRSCADVTVELNDYTCCVGPNGAGKSNVLCALNIFFRSEQIGLNPMSLVEEDFHQKNTNEPVRITVTFGDLEPEALTDFADYVRQGALVISAVARFDRGTGRAEVKQYGQRLGMATFKDFFASLGDKSPVATLKEAYQKIREKIPALPAPGTKDAMVAALRTFEDEHTDLCELIPSEDQFYGFSKGANKLDKFIQWIYVPAVKDATTEQVEARDTSLGRLLARTVRLKTQFSDKLRDITARTQTEYDQLLADNQGALDTISQSLQDRLSEWAHPDASVRLQWRTDPSRSVRIDEPFAQLFASEDRFEGELSRFGHGLQRSYLLALLQELANTTAVGAPRLILACEEPELYQHPPQARHLASVFRSLSRDNSQVIVCSHSPYFVSGEGFEDVRMVRKNGGHSGTTISSLRYADLLSEWTTIMGETPRAATGILAKIHQELQPHLSEMFFTNHLVLVEGLEDVAYTTAYLHLTGRWDDYRRSGCHIVPAGGKSHMIPALLIAKRMGIPTMVVFDSDGDKPDRSGSREKHRKDNIALLTLSGIASPDPFPSQTVLADTVTMWTGDIGAMVESEIGVDNWKACRQRTDASFGQPGGLEKNSLQIAASLTDAWERGMRSSSLQDLCTRIVGFARPARTITAAPGSTLSTAES